MSLKCIKGANLGDYLNRMVIVIIILLMSMVLHLLLLLGSCLLLILYRDTLRTVICYQQKLRCAMLPDFMVDADSNTTYKEKSKLENGLYMNCMPFLCNFNLKW